LSGLGRIKEATALLDEVLVLDGNHAGAADLLTEIKALAESKAEVQ
jgi:hypothetical protein